MELLEPKEWMLEDLNCKEAMIIECPDYGNHTFIGIGQAFTSEGQPYPIGGCAQCLDSQRSLDSEKDLELMMEFRGEHWDDWVRFCLERDYKPSVD
jgi:hypothetical protein